MMPAALALCLALTGCGGGETDAAASFRAEADAAEARALASADTRTCRADHECSLLSFANAFPSCTQHRDAPVLITSAGYARAVAAAESQRALAREAVAAHAGPPEFACADYVDPYPVPYCDQGQCKLRPVDALIPVDALSIKSR